MSEHVVQEIWVRRDWGELGWAARWKLGRWVLRRLGKTGALTGRAYVRCAENRVGIWYEVNWHPMLGSPRCPNCGELMSWLPRSRHDGDDR